MTAGEARDRLAAARVARLATVGPGGAPHVVPIAFAPAGPDALVHAVDHKPKRTRALRRLANIAADPRVSVLADHWDEDWERLWWVRADGTAEILAADDPDAAAAVDLLVARYPQYAGRRPEGPVVRIAVRRWSGWRAG